MKLVFRWYGEQDKVTLENIRQIPVVDGIVSAVYDTPVGTAWSEESINAIAQSAKAHSLSFEVVESVPVSEDIKLGSGKAKEHIEAYKTNIIRLAKAGVKVICYNFMPVFDWLRSDLNKVMDDKSYALYYDEREVLALNPMQSDLSLPGWDASYTQKELRDVLAKYKGFTKADLWANLKKFLDEIIPVCDSCGVKMAIHPDDPPWDIFGLPVLLRICQAMKGCFRSMPLPLTELRSARALWAPRSPMIYRQWRKN